MRLLLSSPRATKKKQAKRRKMKRRTKRNPPTQKAASKNRTKRKKRKKKRLSSPFRSTWRALAIALPLYPSSLAFWGEEEGGWLRARASSSMFPHRRKHASSPPTLAARKLFSVCLTQRSESQ